MFLRSRLFALLLLVVVPSPVAAQRRQGPDSVMCVTTDVANFWRAVDGATSLDLEGRLQSAYLDAATPALRAFIPDHIGNALSLARTVWERRADYERVRPATLDVASAEPAIRTMLHRFAALYPEAAFVDVHFVIGRFSLGGWTRGDTMVIAVELYPDRAMLPRIVAHELAHRQQPPAGDDQTLLTRALNEGAADFVAELAAGDSGTINPAAHAYGLAHERALWAEFRRVMHGRDYGPWLYAGAVGARPPDLGYFIGYRIAQAYYRRAADKRAAVRAILRSSDADRLLRQSGYAP